MVTITVNKTQKIIKIGKFKFLESLIKENIKSMSQKLLCRLLNRLFIEK